MNIDDSIHRWEAYSQLFQKLVDSFYDDIQNDNFVSMIESVFLCNLHALLVSALSISNHALGVAQLIQKELQEEKEQEV